MKWGGEVLRGEGEEGRVMRQAGGWGGNFWVIGWTGGLAWFFNGCL